MTFAEQTLNHDQPADVWLEAFPLGNGVLGAMVFGGVTSQRFQVNDGRAWSGSPTTEQIDPLDPERSQQLLVEIREHLAAGRHAEAERASLGLQHRHSQSYLPYGDFELEVKPHGEPIGYSRELDLSTGIHREHYRVGDDDVTWTSFVAEDPGVLVITLQTSLAAGLDLTGSLTSPLRVLERVGGPGASSLRLQLPADVFPPHDRGAVVYSDDPSASLQGALALVWEHDGDDSTNAAGALRASGVHELTLYLSTETTLAALGAVPVGDSATALATAQRRLAEAASLGVDALRKDKIATHGELYGRVQLRLSSASETGTSSVQRLLQANAHPAGALAADPGLAELLFNYGRYLLISASRPGGAPANLQGIWNKELPAPWSSNYTININLQMNYWAAEALGLQECLEPLFTLIDVLRTSGTETAQRLYGARGWVAHHNADIWGYSQPVGHGHAQPKWARWPMGGFWLAQHLWDHVRFGAPGDAEAEAFARDRAWPVIRGAAEFGLDWMLEQPDGTVGTSPSTSPENAFFVDGQPFDIGVSSTMDLALLSETFRYVVALAEMLDLTDDPVAVAAAAALPKIPVPTTGRGGQIREWLADDPQAEPQHRHMSHMYFVHPGAGVVTPEQAAGAKATLDARGDESTGWSLSWKLALRSRLGQPEKVSDLLRLVFRDMTTDRGGQSGGLYANFFAAHPPYQIDGNFGYVAGLTEALLQSHHDEIVLLPALPAELADGQVDGLRARGGISTRIRWRAGVLESAELLSPVSQTVRVRHAEHSWQLELRADEPKAVPLHG
ncbi:MAG: glycoside hydrolase family 95 protein [Propionibacteriaceae bacterium]